MNRRSGASVSKIIWPFIALSFVFSAQALAQHERVMGAATEGSQHRIRYLDEMERKSAERDRCRALVDTVIQPQLARLDELGLSRNDGPSRAQFENASFEQTQAALHAMRQRLLKLARGLKDAGSQSLAVRKKLERQFAASLRSYTLNSNKLKQMTQESLRKRVSASQQFKVFAQAILTLRDSGECSVLWGQIKPRVPRRLGQRLRREERQAVARVETAERQIQQFASVLSGLKDIPQGGRAVADSVSSADN